tara:strand:+ start:3608 stop:5011 length:1404 start_codon:yes stop_codon:yes gene_type:complete
MSNVYGGTDSLLANLATARSQATEEAQNVLQTKEKDATLAKTLGEAKTFITGSSITKTVIPKVKKLIIQKVKTKVSEAKQQLETKVKTALEKRLQAAKAAKSPTEMSEGGGVEASEASSGAGAGAGEGAAGAGAAEAGAAEAGGIAETSFGAAGASAVDASTATTTVLSEAGAGAGAAGAGAVGEGAAVGATKDFSEVIRAALKARQAGAAAGAGERGAARLIAKPLEVEADAGEETTALRTGAAASRAEQVAQSFQNTTADLGIQGNLDGSIRVGQQAGKAAAKTVEEDTSDLTSDLAPAATGGGGGIAETSFGAAGSRAVSSTLGTTESQISEDSMNAGRAGVGESGISDTLSAIGRGAGRLLNYGRQVITGASKTAAQTAEKVAAKTTEKVVAKTGERVAGEEAGGETAFGILDAIPGADVLGVIGGAILTAVESSKAARAAKKMGSNLGGAVQVSNQVGAFGN